jgi:hypothetical protein
MTMESQGGPLKSQTRSRFIDNFLQSPFAGLAPWIVMSLLSGPGRFEESVSTALGLSILFIYLRLRRGSSLKALEVFEVVYFGTLAIIGVLASDTLIMWLEKWSGEMSSLALAAFTFGSLLVGNPFTLAYAKETTPREYWDPPSFCGSIESSLWCGRWPLRWLRQPDCMATASSTSPMTFGPHGSFRLRPCCSLSRSANGIRRWRAHKRRGHLVSLQRSLLRLVNSSTSFRRSLWLLASRCS